MDKADALKIAEKYLVIVSKKYQIERALVFGSYAKGTNHADSDIKLAIIMKQECDIIDTQIDLMKMRSDDDLLIEPHPFTKNDFQLSNPIVSEIMKSGIVVRTY